MSKKYICHCAWGYAEKGCTKGKWTYFLNVLTKALKFVIVVQIKLNFEKNKSIKHMLRNHSNFNLWNCVQLCVTLGK